MKAARSSLRDNVVPFRKPRHDSPDAVVVVKLELISDDGRLRVKDSSGRAYWADWLQGGGESIELISGDRLLMVFPTNDETPVVIGRIGRYIQPAPLRHVQIESGETLSLRCGQSSLDLRADGKVMIRGEDVLVRARGTKRIKAGTVNIN
jgi:hypothetical protein